MLVTHGSVSGHALASAAACLAWPLHPQDSRAPVVPSHGSGPHQSKPYQACQRYVTLAVWQGTCHMVALTERGWAGGLMPTLTLTNCRGFMHQWHSCTTAPTCPRELHCSPPCHPGSSSAREGACGQSSRPSGITKRWALLGLGSWPAVKAESQPQLWTEVSHWCRPWRVRGSGEMPTMGSADHAGDLALPSLSRCGHLGNESEEGVFALNDRNKTLAT